MSAVEPGTIAVNWDKRCVLIRSYQENYWYDSRYPNIGMILNHDEHVISECEVIPRARAERTASGGG